MSEELERWYNNLKRGSEATAEVYHYALTKFCQHYSVTPQTLVQMDEITLRNLILDYVTLLESQNKSSSYISTHLKAIKNWLKFNGRNLTISIKLPKDKRISQKERVPSRNELKKILASATLKEKAVISLLAFSGVRPNVIGNFSGSDGLRIRDVVDLKIEDYEVEFETIPAMVKVRRNLSKVGHSYLTFLSREGCYYLEIYLNSRIRNEGEIHPDSPLIARKGGGFLRTKSVSALVRGAMRRAGFDYRPYVLRHYFDTYMLLAEAHGLIPRDYRVFWMGHKGDIEHEYTTNKENLPPSLIENMRVKYDIAARTFLETGFFDTREEDNRPKQKVVKPEEIDSWLEAGYEYVTILPDGRIIVKRGD
ncbi:tyrosine-type recombinase/integrase [Archaeoglobus sp.]